MDKFKEAVRLGTDAYLAAIREGADVGEANRRANEVINARLKGEEPRS